MSVHGNLCFPCLWEVTRINFICYWFHDNIRKCKPINKIRLKSLVFLIHFKVFKSIVSISLQFILTWIVHRIYVLLDIFSFLIQYCFLCILVSKIMRTQNTDYYSVTQCWFCLWCGFTRPFILINVMIRQWVELIPHNKFNLWWYLYYVSPVLFEKHFIGSIILMTRNKNDVYWCHYYLICWTG